MYEKLTMLNLQSSSNWSGPNNWYHDPTAIQTQHSTGERTFSVSLDHNTALTDHKEYVFDFKPLSKSFRGFTILKYETHTHVTHISFVTFIAASV